MEAKKAVNKPILALRLLPVANGRAGLRVAVFVYEIKKERYFQDILFKIGVLDIMSSFIA